MNTKTLALLVGVALALIQVRSSLADDHNSDYDRNSNWPEPQVEAQVESRPDGVYIEIEVHQTTPGFHQPGQLESSSGRTSENGARTSTNASTTASSPGDTAPAPATGRTWTDANGIHHETADGHRVTLTPPMIGSASAESWQEELRQHPDEDPYLLYVDDQFGGIIWIPRSADADDLRFGSPPADVPPQVAVPGTSGVTIDPREIALDALDRVPLPDIQIRMNPSLGLVALPAWYWIEGYDERPFGTSLTVDIPAEVGPEVPTELVPAGDPRRQGSSLTVDVRVWASMYEWSFGDGASLVTTSRGKAYPQESDIQHTYEYSSLLSPDGFPVRLMVEFTAEYRVNGGPPQELPPIRRTYETSYRVQELQPVLIAR